MQICKVSKLLLQALVPPILIGLGVFMLCKRRKSLVSEMKIDSLLQKQGDTAALSLVSVSKVNTKKS